MTVVAPSDAGITFLLCEHIRQEGSGKLSLLGFYAGNSFFITSPAMLPAAFPLGILFVLEDGEGMFTTAFSVKSPSGATMIDKEHLPDTTKKLGTPHSITVNILPFQANEFGTYKAILHLDGNSYEREFKVNPRPA